MTISIHQPNFVAWFPFFQKIQQADVFCIMRHCQFEKNNYQNRFFTDKWNTMRVSKKTESIYEKKYLTPQEDWHKIVTNNPKLNCFNGLIKESVCNTNSLIIMRACEMLGINTNIVYDTPTELTGTKRLIHICKKVGANTYLSGISGSKYLDLNEFENEGIKVIYQDEATMIKKPLVDLI